MKNLLVCPKYKFDGSLARAILSTVNPDNYTSTFGIWEYPQNLKEGLEWLLENEKWKKLGEQGYEYVKRVHSTEKGIEAHIRVYEELLR